MTRRLILAAALALALAPQTFAAGGWHKSIAPAQKAAKEKNQLILVDMFADWCGWCHRFEREVFPSEIFQNASADLVLLRLNTEDQKEGTALARKYQVSSLPTFLLLAPDLSVAGVIRGYAPAPQFVQMLKDTRAKYDDFVKRAKDEPKYAKDPMQRFALAKEYVTRGMYDKGEVRLKKLIAEKNIPVAIRDDSYYHLALSYTLQNKLTEAQTMIRELTSKSKLGEAVERAHILSGQIYMQQGNWLGAANEFRGFKTRFPNSPLIRTVDMVLPSIEKQLQMSGK